MRLKIGILPTDTCIKPSGRRYYAISCPPAPPELSALRKLISMPVREQIGRFKYVKEDALDAEFVKVDEELSAQIANAFVKEDR